ADGASDDRVEDRLDIRLRLADDAQDLAGGGLLVQRRGEFAVARLKLGEEAHVLDGDDGLIGEGFQQRDLLGRELSGIGASHGDRTNGVPFAQHRNYQNAPIAERSGERERRLGKSRVVLKVTHFDNDAIQDCLTYLGFPGWSPWVHEANRLESFACPIMMSGEVN